MSADASSTRPNSRRRVRRSRGPDGIGQAGLSEGGAVGVSELDPVVVTVHVRFSVEQDTPARRRSRSVTPTLTCVLAHWGCEAVGICRKGAKDQRSKECEWVKAAPLEGAGRRDYGTLPHSGQRCGVARRSYWHVGQRSAGGRRDRRARRHAAQKGAAPASRTMNPCGTAT
jgi:hypothetical protein